MAISKILHMKQAKTGYMHKHLANAIKYIMEPEKTLDGRYVRSINCDPDATLKQMIDTKRHYGKMDKRQGYHIIISFEEEDVSYDTAMEIVARFAGEYLKSEFEAVYAVHTDTEHPHMHLLFNSVRCSNGYKYDYKNGDWENYIQPIVNRLCEEFQLGTLDLDKVWEKRRRKKEGIEIEDESKEKVLSERNQRIKKDVDWAIAHSDTYEEFQELLRHMGYDLRGKKYLAVCEVGAEHFRRLDALGEEYTEEMLRYRIEKPPMLPDKQEPKKEAELICVFVPYRNRHLTRHQKELFIRKYRAGKVHQNPKFWKYKASLQQLRQLQEEYLFLVENNIRRKDQLEERQGVLDQILYSIGKERRDLMQEKGRYQAVLDTLEQLQTAKVEADLFLIEGYPEFEPEYRNYLQLEEHLLTLGVSISQAVKIEQYFQTESERLQNRRKEILRERWIAKRVKEKVFDKKQEYPDKKQEPKHEELSSPQRKSDNKKR